MTFKRHSMRSPGRALLTALWRVHVASRPFLRTAHFDDLLEAQLVLPRPRLNRLICNRLRPHISSERNRTTAKVIALPSVILIESYDEVQ
jgi:hypothetical protein